MTELKRCSDSALDIFNDIKEVRKPVVWLREQMTNLNLPLDEVEELLDLLDRAEDVAGYLGMDLQTAAENELGE